MKKIFVLFLASLMMGCASENSMDDGSLAPLELNCEYRENPPVVDQLQPRLSWINVVRQGRDDRGQRQSAWQVRVASSEKLLENL